MPSINFLTEESFVSDKAFSSLIKSSRTVKIDIITDSPSYLKKSENSFSFSFFIIFEFSFNPQILFF